MDSDPIVDEIHKVRAKIFKKFNGDMRKYFQYLKEKEKEHQTRLVTLNQLTSPRRCRRKALAVRSGA